MGSNAYRLNLSLMKLEGERIERTFAKTSGNVTGDSEKWPIADRRVPTNDPTNNCGRHFGSSSILVSQGANANDTTGWSYISPFFFQKSTLLRCVTSAFRISSYCYIRVCFSTGVPSSCQEWSVLCKLTFSQESRCRVTSNR